MKVTVEMRNNKEIIDRIMDSSTGIFVAETWGRYFSKYVPMQSGTLSQNYETEPYKVIYTAPYAHKMHEGDDFNFSKEQHPLATAHWEIPSFNANKEKVAKEITSYIARK